MSSVRSDAESGLRRLLRRLWLAALPYGPRYYLGAMLWRLMNGRARNDFLQHPATGQGFFRGCLYTYVFNLYADQYFRQGKSYEVVRRLFWESAGGTRWHLEKLEQASRGEDDLEGSAAPIIEGASRLLAQRAYQWVIEMGCGHGLLIERLASRAASSPAAFVGLDINPEIIALNQQRYAHSRVQYRSCRRLEDFLAPLQPESVLVISRNVFRFLSEEESINCLTWLTGRVPRGAVIAQDQTELDLARERRSRPTTNLMFSHNYAALFDQAGLGSVSCEVKPLQDPPVLEILISGTWG